MTEIGARDASEPCSIPHPFPHLLGLSTVTHWNHTIHTLDCPHPSIMGRTEHSSAQQVQSATLAAQREEQHRLAQDLDSDTGNLDQSFPSTRKPTLRQQVANLAAQIEEQCSVIDTLRKELSDALSALDDAHSPVEAKNRHIDHLRCKIEQLGASLVTQVDLSQAREAELLRELSDLLEDSKKAERRVRRLELDHDRKAGTHQQQLSDLPLDISCKCDTILPRIHHYRPHQIP